MNQIYSDYDNYRWIDFNRWSNSREVNDLVTHLLAGLEVRELSGYRINMKVVVMDLYQSYLADSEQYLAYHRGKVHYANAGSGNHYINNPHISYTNLFACVDHLIDLKCIEHHKGGQFYNEELGEFFGYVSRMRAADNLTTLWDQYKITPEMISKFKPDDLIRLKGEKYEHHYTYKGKKKTKWIKPPMDCPDTPTTRRMSKVIERYNNLLERTKIDVDIECLTVKDRSTLVDKLSRMQLEEKRIILRLADKSVYRVFNNGSLQQGGRFYGAWWIGAPGIVRKYITINGKPTKELDYSGIHIHLLYALKGINYADMNEDPYTLDDGLPDRDLNKLILLTAFNAEGPEDTASAVFDELRMDGLLNRYGFNSHDPIHAKLGLLKMKHTPIAGEIANDYGAKLQYYDSCIIEQLIDHFTKRNMPILTIHDSIICQSEYSEFIKDKMWELYCKTIDKLLNCKIEYKSINPHAGHVIRSLYESSKYKVNSVISNILVQLHIPYNKYTGKVPMINNSIIGIKTDQRDNVCSGKCKYYTRILSKRKHYASIKIELEQHTDNYTNVLRIK